MKFKNPLSAVTDMDKSVELNKNLAVRTVD